MPKGTVKWFNATKPQGGCKDIFVHISAVERAGFSTIIAIVAVDRLVAGMLRRTAEGKEDAAEFSTALQIVRQADPGRARHRVR